MDKSQVSSKSNDHACCACCKKSNKISPDQTITHPEVVLNQYERINGWSCPWHPLQLTAWLFIILFAVLHFMVLVNYLPKAWKAAGYIVPASLLLIHIVYHLLCLFIDPSDFAVKEKRRKDNQSKAVFDRSKRAHVIDENYHCCICLTDVGARSKHCSVCNKCVSEFDHHCKWLNNCVGGQNYRLFLGCIISAFVCGLVIFGVDLYQFIFYFYDQEALLKNTGTSTWKVFVDVPNRVYLASISIIGILLLLTLCLLCHLIIFHLYLICKNMSTYDYIVHLREKQLKGNKLDVESGEISPPRMQPLKGTDKIEEQNYEKINERSQNTYSNDQSVEELNENPVIIVNRPSVETADDHMEIKTGNYEMEALPTTSNQKAEELIEESVAMVNVAALTTDEETPFADRKIEGKSLIESNQNSDSESIESLQEESILENNENSHINNNIKIKTNNSIFFNDQIDCNGSSKNDIEIPETNLQRHSESKKENKMKGNFKKRKSVKKKTKKQKNDLPPIVNKVMRPLPQLPILNEEMEPSCST